MLSGRRPRGSSSTPVSGKIGSTSGRTTGSRVLGRSLMPPASPSPQSSPQPSLKSSPLGSRKHQRRQAPPGAQGQGIGQAHDLEEFDQLPARRLFVPLAVALEQRQQLVNRRFALAGAEQRGGQLEARLV